MQSQILNSIWILCLALYKAEANDVACSDTTTITTLRLKRKLLCNYDPELRPVKELTNLTAVQYHMVVHSLRLHDDLNVLEIPSWVSLMWQDEHLTWDKSEYNGVESLTIPCNRIWVPDVGLTSGPTPISPTGHCLLQMDGQIEAGQPVLQKAKCVTDITRWPFDTHNCSMRVGSWTFYGDQLTLTSYEEGVSTMWYKENRQWALLGLEVERYMQPARGKFRECLTIRIILQRHPGGYAATIFIPAIVLVAMTLATFWLEPGVDERLGLMRVNILCHCMYLIHLGMKLPGNGNNTPLIMTFFRDSLLLAGISLLVSVCAGRMITAARAPPMWVTSITGCVLAFHLGQLLLLGETDPKSVAAVVESEETGDSNLLVGSTTAARGWRLFAIFLDRLCFITYTIIFLILISAFIPHGV